MFPADAFRATLAKAITILGNHSIRYHLTGGITTVIYGEPRMTQDIDIVVDNHAVAAELEPFIASLEQSDFMVDEPAIRIAVEQRDMFQLFDIVEALKLDIYPRELIVGELDRSQAVEVFEGMYVNVASRTDAAASKLVWISKGSHKSRRDFRQIYFSGTDFDRESIRDAVGGLGLTSLFEDVLDESDEIRDS